MDELTKDFLQESAENLDRLDQEFVKPESEPENPELLKSIFRTIHTIKGTCGFLGFSKLEALAHAGESLLSPLRDGELRLTEASADALLEMVGAVRRYLSEIEASGQEGEADTTALIARLKKLQERNSTVPAAPATVAALQTAPPPPEAERTAVTAQTKAETSKSDQATMQPPVKATAAKERKTPQMEDVARQTKHEEPKEAAIRVDVNLLEKQMNLVSELVLLRNRLLQIAAEANERSLNSTKTAWN